MMRTAMVFAVVTMLLPAAVKAGEEKSAKSGASILACLSGEGYDDEAVRRFGADERGMKQYVMAFLRRGPNRPTDPKKAQELQAAHMKNIGRMAAEGKLVLAGPFSDDGDLRGIYVFDAATVAEAEALTRTDPAVQAGSLVMELKPWYGSAALVALDAIHKRISKNNP